MTSQNLPASIAANTMTDLLPRDLIAKTGKAKIVITQGKDEIGFFTAVSCGDKALSARRVFRNASVAKQEMMAATYARTAAKALRCKICFAD